MNYLELFKRATGSYPYPYQELLATDLSLPELLDIPTGLGKTAGVVLAWVWRRRFAGEGTRGQTPRRLVYCLPMRVLVEQTRDNAVRWLHRCDLLGGQVTFDPQGSHMQTYQPEFSDPNRITVHVLMGGEDNGEWDLYPERDMILVGTQDMLLSRALNRGYGMSRYRWPVHFGLFHTDCLWVFDEVQLMGAGLATSAQLEAFRRLLPREGADSAQNGHGCRSVWMSATLREDWLKTVDFKDHAQPLQVIRLTEKDYERGDVDKRWSAPKRLMKARAPMGDAFALAQEVHEAHKPGTRTIVVVNTVRRARELFSELSKLLQGSEAGDKKRRRRAATPESEVPPGDALTLRLVLLHSRFRSPDRRRQLDAALAAIGLGDPGTIVVSTQVIEAGVDVSATTLFSESAPWASLVQRFGRCNRAGDENQHAAVCWVGLPDTGAAGLAAPYELDALRDSIRILDALKDVGPKSLPQVELRFEHRHVVRRRDLIDLFDTTPDLAGSDIDIDRFVREVEETDVRVFWRDWEGDTPPDDEPAPFRDELCPAPIGGFRDFVKTDRAKGRIFRRDFLEAEWVRADATTIYPGQTFLVHWNAGGYRVETGWDDRASEPVSPPGGRHVGLTIEDDWNRYERELRRFIPDLDDYDDDGLSRVDRWQTIAEHTDDVCAELKSIVGELALDAPLAVGLRQAARWHDWGKAHGVFQNAIVDRDRPQSWRGSRAVAKAPGPRKDQHGNVVQEGFWQSYTRKHFRHEFASALGVLHPDALDTADADRTLVEYFKSIGLVDSDADPTRWQAARDLVAYLVAAHHGKVRLLIRSFPNEKKPRDKDGKPQPQTRFARGVWDGDLLPQTDLGGGVIASSVTLSLEPMEFGLCEQPPFAGQPSWLERMARLRGTLGPFRLAFFEALVRAADSRASASASEVGAKADAGGACAGGGPGA
jgi:CRISPR-associated endonuclease/helicase Cas3